MTDEKHYEIKVTQIEELEDGSAIVHLEMGSEAKGLLIEAGFNALVRKHIDELEELK